MEGFIRTTKPALSGPEKVAILLAEIGPFFNKLWIMEPTAESFQNKN